jgi:inner membrane protein
MKVYRWFADLPAFDGMTPDPWCAYFVDLRFLTPGRDAMPFRYGSCRASSGEPWRLLPPQQ